MSKELWDNRYSSEEFAYGELPNSFLKEQLVKLKAGKILFPAEGEGRNAVYAAKLGWEVSAFDISFEGKNKALKLAEKQGVKIEYYVGELQELNYQKAQFDAIGLIFAHFPPNVKYDIHRELEVLLKPGGTIILEAFSKKNLSYLEKDEKVGGPKNIDMLFSLDEIKTYFPDYENIMLEETEVELNEGLYHNGIGSVIRFVGKKR